MDGMSIYECPVCETRQGFFYRWDEIDDGKEMGSCGICGSKLLEWKEDIDCEWHADMLKRNKQKE